MVEFLVTKGKLVVRNGEPLIVVDGEEKALSKSEFILWTSLNWKILNKESLEKEFDRRMKKYGIDSEMSFEQTLNRLKTRGLVAGKSDYLAVDALYNLLKDLWDIKSEDDIVPLAYEKHEDIDSLGNCTRFSKCKAEVLEAIVNLYLKKQIVFE